MRRRERPSHLQTSHHLLSSQQRLPVAAAANRIETLSKGQNITSFNDFLEFCNSAASREFLSLSISRLRALYSKIAKAKSDAEFKAKAISYARKQNIMHKRIAEALLLGNYGEVRPANPFCPSVSDMQQAMRNRNVFLTHEFAKDFEYVSFTI